MMRAERAENFLNESKIRGATKTEGAQTLKITSLFLGASSAAQIYRAQLKLGAP